MFIKRKNYMLLVMFSFLFLLQSVSSECLWAEDVAVIVGQDYKAYSLALQGFKKTCSFSTEEYYMNGDLEEGKRIAELISSGSAKLVFAIGNKAAQVAKLNIAELPIVFCLVINPGRYGLEDIDICGVKLDIPVDKQLKYLRQISPEATRIGVIYDPENNAELIEYAKVAASERGFQIIAVSARTKAEVAEAIKRLERRIDAFWMIPDSLIANSAVFQRLLLLSLSSKAVLICPSKVFVKNGGLFSLDVDYQDLGSQAGDVAKKILNFSSTPMEAGIQSPRKLKLAINLKIAEKIALSIPQSLIDKAEEIFR